MPGQAGRTTAVVLAAGLGTRMKSALPKVLHPICGRPMIEYVLDAAGVGMNDVVKTTLFLASIDDFAAVNAVYATFMPEPPPARSTFAVGALPKGGLVEIEAIARRP